MGKEQKDSGRAMGIVAFFTLFMAIMTFNLIVFPACALSTMEVLGVGQAELTTLTSRRVWQPGSRRKMWEQPCRS